VRTRRVSLCTRQLRRHGLKSRPSGWLGPSKALSHFPSRGIWPTSRAGAQTATKESSPEERGEGRRHPAWQPHRRSSQPRTLLRHSSDQEEALDVWLDSEGDARAAVRPVEDAPAVDFQGGAFVDAPLNHGSCQPASSAARRRFPAVRLRRGCPFQPAGSPSSSCVG